MKIKRIIKTFLVIIVLGFFVLVSKTAYAASEEESNNTYLEANELVLDEEVKGSLSSNSDVDWYSIKINKRGCVHLNFAHDYINSNKSYWIIDVYKDDDIDNRLFHYIMDGETTNRITKDLGYDEGTYYYKVYKGDYHSTKDYYFSINFEQTNYWETETTNGAKANADLIALNETYYGRSINNDDIDWFKFTITESGHFNVTFEPDLTDTTSKNWKIHLYDENGINLACDSKGVEIYDLVAGNEKFKTSEYSMPNGTYYIRIASYIYSYERYALRVNFTPATGWETEPNNSRESAISIKPFQVIDGNLSHDWDRDIYKVVLNNESTVSIVFNHEGTDYLASNKSYWHITMCLSGKTSGVIDFNVDGTTGTTTSKEVKVQAGTYFIEVRNTQSFMSGNHSGEPYSLYLYKNHTHIGEPEPTIKPTCTEKGNGIRTCTLCGTKENVDIDELGHNYEVIDEIKSNIFKQGETTYVCTRCGKKLVKKDKANSWIFPTIISVELLIFGAFIIIKKIKTL
ncbi:MAG: hypothetical protein J6Y28_00535 [Acholeplasmatales bacterium]|nr:hypothetical protein [Acholeplasmatales bacterium]